MPGLLPWTAATIGALGIVFVLKMLKIPNRRLPTLVLAIAGAVTLFTLVMIAPELAADVIRR
jgi:hypothetical protein